MKRIVLFSAMLVAGTALASEWKKVGGTSEFEEYIDLASVSDQGNGVRQVWGKRNYAKPFVLQGNVGQSMVELMQFDCRARTLEFLQVTFFGGPNRDKVIWSGPGGDLVGKVHVVPDSVGDSIAKAVCK